MNTQKKNIKTTFEPQSIGYTKIILWDHWLVLFTHGMCCNILDTNNETIFVLRSIMFLDHTTGDLKETTREEEKNQFTINYKKW